MLAAQLSAPKELNLIEYPLRKLNSDELLVEVDSCGICGTDFSIYNGESQVTLPVIPGHEYAGIVVEKGVNVKNIPTGAKVAVDPNIYCGYCKECRRGRVNFCENHQALGVTLNGGFAQYSIIPQSQAYVLKEDFPLSFASFAEPLSCCIRGIYNAKIKVGDFVGIVGGGTIGLLMLQLAKLAGASKTILIEPNKIKRSIAEKLGADYVYDSNEKELNNKINDLTSGGLDIVIECVGKKEAVETAIELSGRGGRLVIFGLSKKSAVASINLQELFRKELKIQGSFLNPFTFGKAIDLLVSGKVNVELFSPQQIDLKEINKIFENKTDTETIKKQVINKKEEA